MVQRHTASKSPETIWNPITEERFMNAVAGAFQASKQTAGVPKTYEGKHVDVAEGSYSLPFEVEYQLAKDFAFVAAYEEQADAVSAATISESHDREGVDITVASNAGVKLVVRDGFEAIARVLEKCAQREIKRAKAAEDLFSLVVDLDQPRIISRLRCRLWTPPRNFASRPAPLCQSLGSVFKDISLSNPNKKEELRDVISNVQRLADLGDEADRHDLAAISPNLKDILICAGTLTGCWLSLESFLESKKIRIPDADRRIVKSFDKLANYWCLCQRLAGIAANRRSRSSLASIRLNFLEPFEAHLVNEFRRHVHAEVQLVVYHRQRETLPLPRAIGTSKAACYLCDLFLSQHKQYKYSATHGMLYEFWTIPDVLNYGIQDRQELRAVIAFMYEKLSSRAQLPSRGLMFPVQSGIYQPPYVPSVTATTVCSSASSESMQIPQKLAGALEAILVPLSDASRSANPTRSNPSSTGGNSRHSTILPNEGVTGQGLSLDIPDVQSSSETEEEEKAASESDLHDSAINTEIARTESRPDDELIVVRIDEPEHRDARSTASCSNVDVTTAQREVKERKTQMGSLNTPKRKYFSKGEKKPRRYITTRRQHRGPGPPFPPSKGHIILNKHDKVKRKRHKKEKPGRAEQAKNQKSRSASQHERRNKKRSSFRKILTSMFDDILASFCGFSSRTARKQKRREPETFLWV